MVLSAYFVPGFGQLKNNRASTLPDFTTSNVNSALSTLTASTTIQQYDHLNTTVTEVQNSKIVLYDTYSLHISIGSDGGVPVVRLSCYSMRRFVTMVSRDRFLDSTNVYTTLRVITFYY
jgi:hypothetical protein